MIINESELNDSIKINEGRIHFKKHKMIKQIKKNISTIIDVSYIFTENEEYLDKFTEEYLKWLLDTTNELSDEFVHMNVDIFHEKLKMEEIK